MYRLSLFCCLLVAVLLAQGCSGDPNVRPSVEISGTVTLDGAPLQQASIQFTSSKSGESAYANLDENGNYSVSFPQADVGSAYEVTISPPVVEEENAMALAILQIAVSHTFVEIGTVLRNRLQRLHQLVRRVGI